MSISKLPWHRYIPEILQKKFNLHVPQASDFEMTSVYEVSTLNRTHNLMQNEQKKECPDMSIEKPKTYPPEFRESSVKLAIESDQPIAQTAQELAVNPNTLHTRISKYSKPSQSQPVVN